MRYLLILLLLNTSLLKGQNSTVWGHLTEGFTMTTFLQDCITKSITPTTLDEMIKRLGCVHLKHSSDNNVQIGNYSFHFESSPNIYLYKSEDNLTSLYIEEIQNKSDLDNKWISFSKQKGIFSGYNYKRSGFYYLKLDTLFNVSINATLKTDKHIINIQKRLPFYSTNIYTISEGQWIQIDEANACILNIINMICNHLTNDIDKIYFPSNGKLYHRIFTPTERLVGFINFWTEVKYNFAFFDQTSNLDWDAILIEYLPRIQADQSNPEYYKLMAEICAKLNDGHTNIYPPKDLISKKYYPNVELGNFEDRIYVLNTSEKFRNFLPIGSEIVEVNGEKISDYINNNLFPYISASTQYIKQKIAVQSLFEIPTDKKFKIEFVNPKGARDSYEFSFEQDTTSSIISKTRWRPVEFEMLKNNTSFLKINTFERELVVEEFLKLKDSISNSKKLIIDLRENGGGNASFGYEILKYFSPKPFLTSKWMTREHKAAYKAWGEDINDPPSDQFDEECLLTLKGNYRYVAPPDTIEPYYDKFIAIPIVILIGNNTASAAEDFMIAAENIGITETVGDLTYGSTGQPLHIKLPGGGSARICTKKDTYPDGKEFVGYGIKPKYIVKPSINDVLEHRDKVLEFALELK
jgi:C-terminal processing protease CtpA/Prc